MQSFPNHIPNVVLRNVYVYNNTCVLLCTYVSVYISVYKYSVYNNTSNDSLLFKIILLKN